MRMEAHVDPANDSNLFAVACSPATRKENKKWASKLRLITHYKGVAEMSAPHTSHYVT